MRYLLIILGILFSSLNLFSQEEQKLLGKYTYKQIGGYSEELNLELNNIFCFKEKSLGSNYETQGTWSLKDSILILTSYDQKNLIVQENRDTKSKVYTINVVSDCGNLMFYHLELIINDNDTLILRDQFESSKVKTQFSKFRITGTNGIKSIIYTVSSEDSNVFDVKFKNKRIFSAEPWIIIDDNNIRPKNHDGNYRRSTLIRDETN